MEDHGESRTMVKLVLFCNNNNNKTTSAHKFKDGALFIEREREKFRVLFLVVRQSHSD